MRTLIAIYIIAQVNPDLPYLGKLIIGILFYICIIQDYKDLKIKKQ